ncbi:hypothetical protein GCM10009104_23170 [Marinobacterium maritimum]|uniref:Uncharacterized protein n=1 Tax=Marinobacterium maritimum TaxID=500162 RepID=A0ABP3TDI4_9GAMM
MVQKACIKMVLALFVLLWTPTSLLAAALGPQQVEAYLDSLAEVKQLGERMKAAGQGTFLAREISPKAGESFDPHQRAVMALKREHDDHYKALILIVQQRGFTSPESWARVGDRVVLAYGAIKAESESPEMLLLAKQMKGMDPQMLQLLPAEQRVQVEQALIIAEALARVPEADKHQVLPHIARLDREFTQ